jgi:nucleotide-binding universal stress UspA family protein
MVRILVALDGSHLAEAAVGHAGALAQSFESELHLLTVVERDQDPDKPFDAFEWELRRTHAEAYLHGLQNELSRQGIEAFRHVVEGHPPTEIVNFCERHEINLMFLSAYGVGGVTEFACGSTVQKVIARAGVSVMVVQPEASPAAGIRPARYGCILVLLDGSQRSDWALFLATRLAQAHGAKLSLLQVNQEPKVTQRVMRNPRGRKLVEELAEMNTLDSLRHMEEIKAQLPTGTKVRSRVLVASEVPPVVEEIARTDDADLVVLCGNSMSDRECWCCGPASESIIARASRPVLVFRDELEHNITLTPTPRAPARSAKAVADLRAKAG